MPNGFSWFFYNAVDVGHRLTQDKEPLVQVDFIFDGWTIFAECTLRNGSSSVKVKTKFTGYLDKILAYEASEKAGEFFKMHFPECVVNFIGFPEWLVKK